MVDTRGVFSIRLVNKINARGRWVDLNDVLLDITPVPDTGYFGGGASPASPALVSTMDKLTYSTDTTAFTPSANLSTARYELTATGNLTSGYFGGGYVASPFAVASRMDKLTYSTDATAFTPSANLTVARTRLAATGNSTAGYFGGGASPGVSRMDKLTYSTDTTVFTPGANLKANRYMTAATGNLTSGYFGGGTTGVNYLTTMDKLTYSTDTTAATPSANLSVGRRLPGATGNSTNGYFGGGSSPAIVSTMDKLTYSTDTTAFTPSANLTVARTSLAASSAKANALPQSTYGFRFTDGSLVISAPTPTPQTYDGNPVIV